MNNIKLFQDKRIRSVWNEEEEQWYFSVVDVVEALTESPNPRQYWRKMKDRDLKEYESYPFWVQLKNPHILQNCTSQVQFLDVFCTFIVQL